MGWWVLEQYLSPINQHVEGDKGMTVVASLDRFCWSSNSPVRTMGQNWEPNGPTLDFCLGGTGNRNVMIAAMSLNPAKAIKNGIPWYAHIQSIMSRTSVPCVPWYTDSLLFQDLQYQAQRTLCSQTCFLPKKVVGMLSSSHEWFQRSCYMGDMSKFHRFWSCLGEEYGTAWHTIWHVAQVHQATKQYNDTIRVYVGGPMGWKCWNVFGSRTLLHLRHFMLHLPWFTWFWKMNPRGCHVIQLEDNQSSLIQVIQNPGLWFESHILDFVDFSHMFCWNVAIKFTVTTWICMKIRYLQIWWYIYQCLHIFIIHFPTLMAILGLRRANCNPWAWNRRRLASRQDWNHYAATRWHVEPTSTTYYAVAYIRVCMYVCNVCM